MTSSKGYLNGEHGFVVFSGHQNDPVGGHKLREVNHREALWGVLLKPKIQRLFKPWAVDYNFSSLSISFY
jgi:hypothetical protein